MPLTDVLCHRVVTPEQRFIVFVLIMPFAPLGDLKKYIQHIGQNGLDMSVARLRTFLLHIVEALEAVHEAGAVHKDIKSSNILLFPGRLESDAKHDLVPKLSDFGITQKTLDQTHGLEGTPEYMAPESFTSGYKPDLPSDVYSLGLLFYEIITGRLPYKASVLSMTERFTAYQALHNSGNIDFVPLKNRMGSDMETLVRDMVALDPSRRPKIRHVVNDINRQIIIAEHGEITAQGTNSIPWNTYRWNPFVHERLGDRLCYFFLKGQNSKNDPIWICDNLTKADVHGFSLYRVIGGIDLLLRIWERPGVTSNAIERVVADFRRLQNGQILRFKVDGFHAMSSKPQISFARLDKIDVGKLIFDNLKENRESEFQSLSQAGLVNGKIGYDITKDSHPLRFFVAFRIGDHNTHSIHKRIFAREVYEALLPFQESNQAASISTYWGEEAYSLLVKLRLVKFEDYELLWDACIKAVNSVDEGAIVQSDTFLELSRTSIRESDDGAVWKDVEKYRVDNRLSWPNTEPR